MHPDASAFVQQNGFEKLVAHFRNKGPVALLESQQVEHKESKTSYLAALTKRSISITDDVANITVDGNTITRKGNPWQLLSEFKQGSWLFGWLGYDLKNHTENLTTKSKDPQNFSDTFFFEPGFLLSYDHQKNQAELLTGEWPDKLETEYLQNYSISELVSNKSKQSYMRDVEKAQKYIFEGDCYEINISRQLRGQFRGDPLQLYTDMKRRGPVPFGAYLFADGKHICSASPERFVKKNGHRIISDPIKGTVERGLTAKEDQQNITATLLSEKNKAENLMIVDLVRHDFSRVCKPGSVRVTSLFDIQTFATLHQLVSRVEAEIAQDYNVFNVLSACFPMGSMTGAPKISVMNFIEEIEEYKRGVYSGGIGYISPDDDFDFNVVIRTALISENTLHYSVGGAITSESSPEEEWQETQVKARALIKDMF